MPAGTDTVSGTVLEVVVWSGGAKSGLGSGIRMGGTSGVGDRKGRGCRQQETGRKAPTNAFWAKQRGAHERARGVSLIAHGLACLASVHGALSRLVPCTRTSRRYQNGVSGQTFFNRGTPSLPEYSGRADSTFGRALPPPVRFTSILRFPSVLPSTSSLHQSAPHPLCHLSADVAVHIAARKRSAKTERLNLARHWHWHASPLGLSPANQRPCSATLRLHGDTTVAKQSLRHRPRRPFHIGRWQQKGGDITLVDLTDNGFARRFFHLPPGLDLRISEDPLVPLILASICLKIHRDSFSSLPIYLEETGSRRPSAFSRYAAPGFSEPLPLLCPFFPITSLDPDLPLKVVVLLISVRAIRFLGWVQNPLP